MTTTIFVLAFAGHFISIVVILALLRQLNNERGERKEMQDRYRELALRVRAVQLREEVPDEDRSYEGIQMRPFEHSTTTEMDGS